MKKILNVSNFMLHESYYIRLREDEPGILMKISNIKSSFGNDIANEIKKFYSDHTNTDKRYNLVLLTDEELKNLEGKTKQ
jgi:hypothetical protein